MSTLSRCALFTTLALVGWLSAAAWGQTPGVYRVTSQDLPATVQPGQQVVGHLTLQVVTPGDPVFDRPVAGFSGPSGEVPIPADKISPWELPPPHQAGQELSFAFRLDLPATLPPGEGAIWVQLARNRGGTWEYASLQDAAGQDLGDTLRQAVRIVPGGAASGPGAEATPLVVPRIAAPTLDGQVDPAEWASAAQLDLVDDSTGGAPQAATHAWLGFDDQQLYVAFRCEEPDLDHAAQVVFPERDASGLYTNECVEIFLSPGEDRGSFRHFIVDLLGQRWDALGRDAYGFNPTWEARAFRGEGFWSVEAAFPFSAVGLPAPAPGLLLWANLNRERYAVSELSSWRPTGGHFEAPGYFGPWVLEAVKPRLTGLAEALTAGEPAWPASMTAAAEAWRGEVTALRDRLAALDEPAAQAGYAHLTAEIARLQRGLATLKLQAAREGGAGFVVAQAWPYEAFSGQPGPLDRLPEPVQLSLLRDEWVDLAFNLTNPTDRTVTLRCTTRYGDLAEPGMGFLRLGLPGLTALWQQAMPVATGDGRPIYDALVPIPSGVVQVPPGETAQVWLALRAGADSPASVEGHAYFEPVDGSAGAPVAVPLSARVVPVSLTADSPIQGCTWDLLWFRPGEFPAWTARHFADLRDHGIDTVQIHGLTHTPRPQANPDGTLQGTLDFTALDALIAATRDSFRYYYWNVAIMEKGSQRRDLFGLDFADPAYEKAFKTWFGAIMDHLAALGVEPERILFNPVDESLGPDCRILARWGKEVQPRVKVIVDSVGNGAAGLEEVKQIAPLVDIWVPHFGHFQDPALRPTIEYLRSLGKPIWGYFYSQGPNEKDQDPTRHYLAKYWWSFANDVQGVCFWANMYYGDPWYRADAKTTYDTSLRYPIEGDVAPSRRWQAWRRGWQDYCLLDLARRRLLQAGDNEGLARLNQWVETVVRVPGDPTQAEAARAWLREVLTPASLPPPDAGGG